MIVVTGGAGFIGSRIVRALNDRGETDIVVVDDLTDGHKFRNLVDCEIQDYIDRNDFLPMLSNPSQSLASAKAIFHEGACSTTTEWDGEYMMHNNYDYSKVLLHFCAEAQVPFLYASSAAVYGGGKTFVEQRQYETPLNVYGYSKFQFDQYVRRHLASIKSQVVGFRYFNVYGPNEAHKGSMASVAWHLHNQLLDGEGIKLFAGCDGYDDGEQRRDFVYVDDVTAVNLWFLFNNGASGIYNLGTGRSEPFNAVAEAVLAWHGRGSLDYIPFPDHLRGCYQSFTEADIGALRTAGYNEPFLTVAEGVKNYLDVLAARSEEN